MRYPIVCIKDSYKDHSSSGLPSYNKPVSKNTTYYTSSSRLDYDWLQVIHVSNSEGEYVGTYDKKLFITLAEWREQQINLILDEE
jgi:hypothetical protein